MTELPPKRTRPTALTMRNQPISDAVMEQLAQRIRSDENLISVDFRECNISDKGAAILAESIAGHPSLYKLNLSGNPFGDAGAVAIMDALKTNRSLRVLKMSGCGFRHMPGEKWVDKGVGDDTIAALADALQVNPVLNSVSLGNVPRISQEGKRMVAQLMADSQIAELTMQFNYDDFKEAGLAEIVCAGTNRNLVEARPASGGINAHLLSNLNRILLGHERNCQGKHHALTAVEIQTLQTSRNGVLHCLRRHIGGLADVNETPEALQKLVEMEQGLDDFLAKLPEPGKDAVTLAELFAANEHGLVPLDNPKVWQQLPELADVLNGQGTPLNLESLLQTNRFGQSYLQAGIECGFLPEIIRGLSQNGEDLGDPALFFENGKATPLLGAVMKTGTVPALFYKENWQGKPPQAAKQFYRALPEEAKTAVTNLHALTAQLKQQSQVEQVR